jgi:hypothetical protein
VNVNENMPWIVEHLHSLHFPLNYPSTSPVLHDTDAPALQFEEQRINFYDVAAMILPSNRLDDPRQISEPMIILYMTDIAILPLISKHLGGNIPGE